MGNRSLALTVAGTMFVLAAEDRILYKKEFTKTAKYMGLEQYDRSAHGNHKDKNPSPTMRYLKNTATLIGVTLVLMLVGYLAWCYIKKYKDKKKREEEEKKRAMYKDPEAHYQKQNMMSTPMTTGTTYPTPFKKKD